LDRQSRDEGMMLNDAMFAGTNGWILKPSALRGGNMLTGVPQQRTLDLRITVLAGQFLPLPGDGGGRSKTGSGFGITSDRKFRPRVKVELHVDRPHRSEARETAAARTEHPDWGRGAKSLDFLGVKNVVEELSFVK
jgi:hypothetical protein